MPLAREPNNPLLGPCFLTMILVTGNKKADS